MGNIDYSRFNEIEIDNPEVCQYCKSKGLNETDKYCPNCGFPQNGTHKERVDFLLSMRRKKSSLKETNIKVNNVKTILFIIAGLNLFVGIILGLIQKDIITLIVCVITSIIYFGLAIWSNKNPFPAILTGFLIYVSLQILSSIIDPSTIIRGIVIKIAFIVAFINGMISAKKSEKLSKEIEEIKKPKDFKNDEKMSEM